MWVRHCWNLLKVFSMELVKGAIFWLQCVKGYGKWCAALTILWPKTSTYTLRGCKFERNRGRFSPGGATDCPWILSTNHCATKLHTDRERGYRSRVWLYEIPLLHLWKTRVGWVRSQTVTCDICKTAYESTVAITTLIAYLAEISLERLCS